jgi:hypothetical protein
LASARACSARAEAAPITATPATRPRTSQGRVRDRDGVIRQASRWTQRSTSSTPAAASRVATPPRITASQRARCELSLAAATDDTTRSRRSSARVGASAAAESAAKPSPATTT